MTACDRRRSAGRLRPAFSLHSMEYDLKYEGLEQRAFALPAAVAFRIFPKRSNIRV